MHGKRPALWLLAFLLLLPLRSVRAEEASASEAADWSLDTLLSLGAVPPDYRAATGVYELSSPEQLLFLTGAWKNSDANGDGYPDAPANGCYRLTADIDMAACIRGLFSGLAAPSGNAASGDLPPIAAMEPFTGVFDGGNHTISNLVIHGSGSASGLIGLAGDSCRIENLALSNILVSGDADCGALLGSGSAQIRNCFASGAVFARENAGGLVGTLSEGLIENCAVFVDITASHNAGGLVGRLCGGARTNLVAGSVTGAHLVNAGGLAGSSEAGVTVEGNVVAARQVAGVTGGEQVGRLVGSFGGGDGRYIRNNLVYCGTHAPESAAAENMRCPVYAGADRTALSNADTYRHTLGWDFNSAWRMWAGDAASMPMLSAFSESAALPSIAIPWAGSVPHPVLTGDLPVIRSGYTGEPLVLSAALALPDGVQDSSLGLVYGSSPEEMTHYLPFASGEDGGPIYTVTFPEAAAGRYYYRYVATIGPDVLTYPNSGPVELTISERIYDAMPRQILVSPGADESRAGIHFITSPDGAAGLVRYREMGTLEWIEVPTEAARSYIDAGWDECVGHHAELSGLTPGKTYAYQAVGVSAGGDFESEIYSFSCPHASEDFTLVLASGLGGEGGAGETRLDRLLRTVLPEQFIAPDGLVLLGNSVSEGGDAGAWATLFDRCGGLFASLPTLLVPGEGERRGDSSLIRYSACTELPGGCNVEGFKPASGALILGDACLILPVFTSDPEDAVFRASRLAMQKIWAKKTLSNSGCRWRVALIAGDPLSDPALSEEVGTFCRELSIDVCICLSEGGSRLIDFSDGACVMASPGSLEDSGAPGFLMLTGSPHGLTVSACALRGTDEIPHMALLDDWTLNENRSGLHGRSFSPIQGPSSAASLVSTPEPLMPLSTQTPALPIILCFAVILGVASGTLIHKKKKAKKAAKGNK